MSWIQLSGTFSASSVAQSVERRFGLIGYARLIKMLELLALSPVREVGQVALSESDWLGMLQVPLDDFHALLNHLKKSGWLQFSQDDEPGSALVVDFLHSDTFVPADAPILLTSADNWAFWCQTELNMPSHVTADPYTQQLFRRWCASNVTVTEMNLAVAAAIGLKADVSPDSLHKHLQAVRSAALATARG